MHWVKSRMFKFYVISAAVIGVVLFISSSIAVVPNPGHAYTDIDFSNNFAFTAGGDLGIGTTTPIHDLQVSSPAPTTASYVSIGNSDRTSFLGVYSGQSGDRNPSIIWSSGANLKLGTANGDGTFSSFTERVRIDSMGRVGIGTNNPQRDLHINNVMRLQPRATAPAAASSGDLYVDSTPTPDELCFYDGSAWQGISSGTDSNCI